VLDRSAIPLLKPALGRAAAVLVRRGVGADAVTLAGFAVGANGRLAPIGHWPTQAQPRGFAISPSGRWLIAAGQLSNAVNVHAIDTATGHLTLRHEHAVGRNPNWVEAIALT